jgi:EAL domain-containing protein (putative c-di-GMP-specific phosphodiesterase class I)
MTALYAPVFEAPPQRRLLVVDDELVQRLIVGRTAQSLSFKVDFAGEIGEAGALLCDHVYDVIVLDLSLGRHDGVELLRTIAASGSDPAIILISGFNERVRASASHVAEALSIRVVGTLSKPLDIEALRTHLLADPPCLKKGAPAELPIEADELAAALSKGEIRCAFQPKIALSSGRPCGAEALARWTSPLHGAVPPDLFVGLAERTGQIDRLTDLMLRQALHACANWRFAVPAMTVAVNLSPDSLNDLALPDRIETMLAERGLPSEALIIEITETRAMPKLAVAADVLTRLRIKGIQLSIDDFGTGYSSLLSLLNMPFTELKIDRSFVQRCAADADSWKIVRASVSLAHELGMRVVAEGVETAGIEERLRQIGCDVVQGWLHASAMAAPEMMSWLMDRAARR